MGDLKAWGDPRDVQWRSEVNFLSYIDRGLDQKGTGGGDGGGDEGVEGRMLVRREWNVAGGANVEGPGTMTK